jgi:hypothetical protein
MREKKEKGELRSVKAKDSQPSTTFTSRRAEKSRAENPDDPVFLVFLGISPVRG